MAGPDEEGYRLCFRLPLTASPDSLRYQLDEVEAFSWFSDTLGSYPVEDALASADARTQAVLTGFRQRLAAALRGW